MALDFSKLDKIAYRGFGRTGAGAQQTALAEGVYTAADGAAMPITGEAMQGAINPIPQSKNAPEGLTGPHTGLCAGKDYRALYRAAYNFHERHRPPKADSEYWKRYTALADEQAKAEYDYWETTSIALSEIAAANNNDSFLIGLLVVVYGELEREYKGIRELYTSAHD